MIEECEQGILFLEAHQLFVDGDYEQAASQFEELPEEYLDTELYLMVLDLHSRYKTSELLETLRSLDEITRWIYDKYNELVQDSTLRTYGIYELENDFLLPMVSMFDTNNPNNFIFVEEYYEEEPDVYFVEPKEGAMADFESQGYYGNPITKMFTEYLYRYYEQCISEGADITALEEFPYRLTDNDVIDSNLMVHCAYKLDANIKTKGLIEYYEKQDNSICPVDVSGNGVYICGDYFPGYFSFAGYAPLFFAVNPEQVRYVVNTSETHSYYGTYDNNTKGYSTTLKVVLKDVSTGTILFTKSYTTYPPHSTARTSFDTYATASWNVDDIKNAFSQYIPGF